MSKDEKPTKPWRSAWVLPKAMQHKVDEAWIRARKREGVYFSRSRYVERILLLGFEREREQVKQP